MKKYIALLLFFGSFGVALANHLGPWKPHPDSECPNGSNLCPLSYAGMSLVSCSMVSIPGVMAQCTYDGRSAANRSSAVVSAGSSVGNSRVVINIPISTAASPTARPSVPARRATAPALGSRAAATFRAAQAIAGSRIAPSAAATRGASVAPAVAAPVSASYSANAPAMPSSFSAPSAFSAVAPVAGNAPAILDYMRGMMPVGGNSAYSVSLLNEQKLVNGQVESAGRNTCDRDGGVNVNFVVAVNNTSGNSKIKLRINGRDQDGGGQSNSSNPFSYKAGFSFKVPMPIIQPNPQQYGSDGQIRPVDTRMSLSVYEEHGNPRITSSAFSVGLPMCPVPCGRITTESECNRTYTPTDQLRCRWDDRGMGGPGGIGGFCAPI